MVGGKVYTLYIILSLLLTVVAVSRGWWKTTHFDVQGGKCPYYPSHKNFSESKFQGRWIVAEEFLTLDRFRPCQELTFSLVSNDSFLLIETLFEYAEAAPRDDGTSYSDPASMKWTWGNLPTLVEYVTVLDTDYDNYAVVVLCQDHILFHAEYPILLTRKMHFEVTSTYEAYINRAKNVIPFRTYQKGNKLRVCKPVKIHDFIKRMMELSFDIEKKFRHLQQ